MGIQRNVNKIIELIPEPSQDFPSAFVNSLHTHIYHYTGYLWATQSVCEKQSRVDIP